MEATDNSELWDQLTQPADINSAPDKIILDTTNVIAPSDVTIWHELSDEEAYKCAPRSRMNLHRNSSPKCAFPGWMCIAKLFFTNYLEKPILKKHRVKYIETYLDEYINGWDNFQSYSERSIRFGMQSVQDRRDALYAQFVKLRAKYKYHFAFTAEPYLRQMGCDAGFMFALAQELREIDAIIPVSQEYFQKEPTLELNDFIIKDSEKVLRFIETELKSCRAKQGKLIAAIIIVLRETGYIVQTEGKLTRIHDAFCKMYPGKIGRLTGIVDYINSHDNPGYIGDKKITENELNQLQQKLKNFVE